MAKFKKKVLEPGTYQSPDGEIVITPERITHWVNSFQKMKAAGLKIPTPWGHQTKANNPDYDEIEFNQSKYNAGFLENFEKDAKGALVAIVDVPREEDAEKVGTIVQEVSPQVETAWKDGKGRVWEDVITHLAFVTHPVVPGQDNFESITPLGATRLSLKHKLSNSITGEVKMAKENEGLENEVDEVDETEETSKPAKKSKKPKKDKEMEHAFESGDNETSGLDAELIDLLASVGIIIPDDTTQEDFMPALKAACATLKHSKEGGAGDMAGGDQDLLQGLDLSGMEDALAGAGAEQDGGKPPEDPAAAGQEPNKGPLMEQPPSMSMSLNKNYEDQLAMVSAKLEEADRARMSNEIELLLSQGKITPVIASKLKGDLKQYRLSLSSNGKHEPPMVQSHIDNFKLMPEGSAWSNDQRIRLSKVAEEALPSEFKNFDEAEANKIADSQLRATGRTTSYQF